MKPRSLSRPYNRVRLWFIVGLFGTIFVVIFGRLYGVQVLQHAELHQRASQQYLRYITLRPERGRIIDRQGHVLATSVLAPSIYVVPPEIEDPRIAALQLAAVLQQSSAEVYRRLVAKTQFAWLARHVSPDTRAEVQRLGIKGVHFRREPRRYYPKRHLAGQVLGFVGVDEQGLGGLEYQYNRELAGKPLRVALRRDAVGRQVGQAAGTPVSQPRGGDLYVTLDEWLQHLAEREIAEQVSYTRAQSGLVIMMQPQTGDLLAIASYPFFDPNKFRDPQQRVWQRNRAITDPVEPGSTFKFVAAAASLENDLAQLDEMIFCENGLMRLGRRLIHDHKPYGWLSFVDVFAFSSNIGTVKVGERLRPDQLYRYMRRFGFGEKSRVGLPGEAAGYLRAPKDWSRFSLASLVIGQELTVTPLQLITAFAAIANGGELIRPRVVERIESAGNTRRIPTVVRRRVVSPSNAAKLTMILTQAVAYGTGRKAALESYVVAGKTGTAQKVDPEYGGYSRKVLASFVGYVPAHAPQLVILVMLDEPQRLRWGGLAAAPVFRRIAQQALPYLQVPAGQGPRRPIDRPAELRFVQQRAEVGMATLRR
ncbi:MAG: penicillin-binding protein 2 [bacterium]|nr:penicillin-binding protein 2 [bacterium]